jgi:hypothetical protein
MMIGFSPRGCWYEHLLRTLQPLYPQRATARSVPTLDESGFSKGVGIASGSGRTLRIGARKLAVVCSGLRLNRAISKKRASIKLNCLGCEKRPEKPLRLFRNQQVAGSIPAGGSIKLPENTALRRTASVRKLPILLQLCQNCVKTLLCYFACVRTTLVVRPAVQLREGFALHL